MHSTEGLSSKSLSLINAVEVIHSIETNYFIMTVRENEEITPELVLQSCQTSETNTN